MEEFFMNYWKWIVPIAAEVFLLLVNLFLLIFRKKPVLSDDVIKRDILERLPLLIDLVECPGSGQEKKNQVIAIIDRYLERTYNLGSMEIFDRYYRFISDSIETILNTPQKKGEKNEEKSKQVRR